MVANSAMDTKSLSRVEHVERVEGWKKVERFMAGWSATEMPRKGIRPCGLTLCEENTTVVIYCGNHVRLFIFPNLSRLTTSRPDFFGLTTS